MKALFQSEFGGEIHFTYDFYFIKNKQKDKNIAIASRCVRCPVRMLHRNIGQNYFELEKFKTNHHHKQILRKRRKSLTKELIIFA